MLMPRLASGVLMVMASFTMLACGGDAPDSSAGDTGSAATSSTPAVAAPAAGTIPAAMQAFSDDGNVAEIAIEGDDFIRYNIDRFSVKAGQMVRITLTHTGALPAQAMGHNVVIIFPDDDVFEFGADVGAQGGSAENDYVPEALRDRVIAFTAMIGGGESATVEFQAPTEPGEYPFLCAFPGHFGQMNGIMVVE